ncbi:XylR family transcriptional regulator [Opitutus terrae]|uniref:Transcriptional regulator, AraC family n=1 Tax=Opitutus terrae (strain DSM 11246 / JCM 15787 / PB90-1) TaxID=452637 RepID=B1ZT55_OPITP|nr:DNA-binding transcriptional regulator [Opitutus terrae]ACB76509.1 transcriptional regulator, AraC family [Opitutus terrae PB90-1]
MNAPLVRSSRKVLVAAAIAPPECIRGITRHARAHDWHLVMDMLFTGALPRGWNGSGVLALGAHQPELLAHLQASGLPCVVLTDGDPIVDLPRVEPDHRAIGRLAADHFLERAHRSFAWAPFLNDAANRERLAGFQERLAEHGRTCRLLPPAHTRIGPYWQDNWDDYRRNLAAELLRLPRPTAIFAFNDCTAANVIDCCQDAALAVPEDVAVLGVGNSLVCELSPVPLSSVDDDMTELGYRAALLLESVLSGAGTATRTLRIPPRGIVTRLSSDMAAVTDPRVARALHYIAEHYSNPMLTVCQVAEALGMSRRNLERSFRDETGCTIHENIIAVRMREASRLLRMHPSTKTSDVAGLVGISGVGTFCRTFRRHFGMSPQAHRDWVLRAEAEPPARPRRPQPATAVRMKITAA